MPSQYNKEQVKLIKEKLSQAKSMVLVDYSGTDAQDQTKLRAMIKSAQGEMFVAKNNLIKLAIDNKELEESLVGMNALVLSYEDAVAALKQVFEFKEETDKLEIKQGLMAADDGMRVLSSVKIEQLSQIPGQDELMVMLMQRLQSPAYGLVNVLNAGPRNLIYVLQAIAEEKE